MALVLLPNQQPDSHTTDTVLSHRYWEVTMRNRVKILLLLLLSMDLYGLTYQYQHIQDEHDLKQYLLFHLSRALFVGYEKAHSIQQRELLKDERGDIALNHVHPGY